MVTINFRDRLFNYASISVLIIYLYTVMCCHVAFITNYSDGTSSIIEIILGLVGLIMLDTVTLIMLFVLVRDWLYSTIFICKVYVDAGNVYEVAEKLAPNAIPDHLCHDVAFTSAHQQIEDLINKWHNPSSDGTGSIWVAWRLAEPLPDGTNYQLKSIHKLLLVLYGLVKRVDNRCGLGSA
jgi:hypothetical protein